jgi:hypothetical protein
MIGNKPVFISELGQKDLCKCTNWIPFSCQMLIKKEKNAQKLVANSKIFLHFIMPFDI